MPEPKKKRIILFVTCSLLVLAAICCALIDVNRTVTSSCLLDPARRWTLSELRPGSFETRAEDILTGNILQYRLYQFDRPSFIDLNIAASVNEKELPNGERVWVEAGQVLARTSSTALDLELLERTSDLSEAMSKLEVLKSGVKPEVLEQATIAVELASTEFAADNLQYQRITSLYQQEMISKEELDAAKAANDLLKLKQQEAEANYRVLNSQAAPWNIAAAERNIVSIEQQLASLNDQVAAQGICTPFDGYLSQQNSPRTLLKVVDTDSMVIRIMVPQRQGKHPKPGHIIDATFPGLTTGVVTGQVARVGKQVVLTAAGPFLVVYGLLPNPDGNMVEGMLGKARISCERLPFWELVKQEIVGTLRQELWPQ